MEFVLPVGDSFDDPYQQDTCKIANYSTRFYFFCGCGRFFNFFDDFWHYITCTMANSSTGYDCFRGYQSLCKITNQSSTQQWVTFTNVYWSAVFYLRLSKLISCLFVLEVSWVFPSKWLSNALFSIWSKCHSDLQFKWYTDNQHYFFFWCSKNCTFDQIKTRTYRTLYFEMKISNDVWMFHKCLTILKFNKRIWNWMCM